MSTNQFLIDNFRKEHSMRKLLCSTSSRNASVRRDSAMENLFHFILHHNLEKLGKILRFGVFFYGVYKLPNPLDSDHGLIGNLEEWIQRVIE
jgi:hypothetical protein